MNLLINGAEALGDGEGSVTIGVEACCLRSADLATCYFAENVDPGTFVRLEVRDTGCGMSTEQKARMFDPFYTTKLKGRGLGLSTTLGVIRGHGGAIRVTSAPGEGSTVEVFLPST